MTDPRQRRNLPPRPNQQPPRAEEHLPENLADGLLESPIWIGDEEQVVPDTSPSETLDEPVDLIDELRPMYASPAPFLARFLPQSAPTYQGLKAPYCDLHAFLKYLHEIAWHGYIHASLGDQSAYVLVFEGRTVAAAAASATGEQALGEMLNLYEQGAGISAHPLSHTLAHVLSGVGSRAWKFNLTEDFTGLHARPSGAIFYARGEIVATMPATLPYEGAFPAPLRPQTLILPRSLAGWAHHTYSPTLRGRDAVNPITDIHLAFKAKYGPLGIGLMKAILQNLTPAEYAMREDLALHEIEPLLQDFSKTGYLRDE